MTLQVESWRQSLLLQFTNSINVDRAEVAWALQICFPSLNLQVFGSCGAGEHIEETRCLLDYIVRHFSLSGLGLNARQTHFT